MESEILELVSPKKHFSPSLSTRVVDSWLDHVHHNSSASGAESGTEQVCNNHLLNLKKKI